MLNLSALRSTAPKIIIIGLDPRIVQAILDFDYLRGADRPSVVGFISSGRKRQRMFWGAKQISLPVYPSFPKIPPQIRGEITLFLNLSSGRRTKDSSLSALSSLPNLLGGVNFAEGVPERHALEIYQSFQGENKFILGPASIGILIPNLLKLGPIGGVFANQLSQAHVFTAGNIAAFSASGGMTNEIINILKANDKHLSFSLSFGGERFPGTTPLAAFKAAQEDSDTKFIVYFGELGGIDEYEIAEAMASGAITKPVIAYIAGTIAEMFETPPQFGHAKAMAQNQVETAHAKSEALNKAGAKTANSFTEFIELIKNLPSTKETMSSKNLQEINNRHQALFTSSISGEKEGEVYVLGEPVYKFASSHTLPENIISILLGKRIKSEKLVSATDLILKLLIDHSPQVSGAVNTMISARAGKDLVSSLASGLLTIGPRFGGAINQAAQNWLNAVKDNTDPEEFVENFAKRREYIQGIGHKKYRSDNPDPRVEALSEIVADLQSTPHLDFAHQVEKITTSKKANLVLNVDGAIAALLLDLLYIEEEYPHEQLQELVDTEFFNALFVLSRSIGFTAHYLDQRRQDEGLFRLPSQELELLEEIK